MKWFRNKEMLKNTLDRNKARLDKTKSDNTKYLLLDYNNLIQDHLLVLDGLDEACKILSWDCPCSQDLIDDLDCENRCTPDIDYAECWKKYFLK
jgi:hypothetical protein